MVDRTITGANVLVFVTIPGVYDAPQQLQGFDEDDVTNTEPVDSMVTKMGVDGRLSGGFVFAAIKQNIMLQGDSSSNDVLENWYQAQQSLREAIIASGFVIMTAIQRKYTFSRGFLTSIPPMPGVKKVIQPRTYQLTYNRVIAAAAAVVVG